MKNDREIFAFYSKVFERNERETDAVLRTDEYIVVRIDGVKFSSKILKKNNLKTDDGYFLAMTETAKKIMDKFPSIFVSFICNDEISFLFDATQVVINNHNRVQKLVSKVSSMASVFLMQELFKLEDEKYVPLMKNAIFAGKVFNISKTRLNDYLNFRQTSSKIANEGLKHNNILGTFVFRDKNDDFMTEKNVDMVNKRFLILPNTLKLEIVNRENKKQ